MSFFEELKRRNVVRVGIAYAVSAWVLLQLFDIIGEILELPAWGGKMILAALVIGFFLALILAWVFELTPEGLKKETEIDRTQSITHVTGRKLDRAIVAVLIIALAYFAYDKFVLDPKRDTELVVSMNQVRTEQATADREVEAESDKSIAVLPFADMSPNKDQDYFSDGLSEELLNLLAKIPQLKVAARTSSFQFKGQTGDIADIGKQLKVAHLLEGSVRTSGNQVRVTTQLIQVEDGYHLWSETYDRNLDDIFAIQDEIAGAVVAQLKITLLGEAPRVRETDPAAYALYLQALQLGRQNTPESLKQSINLYQQALELDPNYAAAWAGLATNYNQQATSGLIPTAEGFNLAREAANKALAIDPGYALAHAVLGDTALLGDRDLAAAARHTERALELEPGNTDILRSAAKMFRVLGRPDSAIAVCEYMVALDPVNNNGYYTLALMNRFSGELDAAIAEARKALILSPGRIGAHNLISEALLLKDELDAALEEIQKEESVWRQVTLPMVYHALGRSADSDAALSELIEEDEQGWAYNIAYIFAFRGEDDHAFEWLDKAVEYDDPGLGDLPSETFLTSLHDDPRWLPLLESLGKSPAQLDAIEFRVQLPD